MTSSKFLPALPSLRHALVALAFIWVAGCGREPVVKVAPVRKTTVEATVVGVNSGTVRAEQVAELAFGAVGRVKALHVNLGDTVKQGAVLAELENDDLVAVYDTARAELARREYLFKSKLISEAEVDQIRSSVDGARVALEKSRVVAPYDGLIAELNLEVGQLSQITAVVPKPLIRIVDLAPRYVRAEIDEVDLPKVAVGQEARVKILAVRSEPYRGVVRKVVPFVSSIREQDRTSEIELDVLNEGALLPVGASADIEIVVERHADVLAVPARAILGRRDERYVFTLVDGRADKTPITRGIYNYDVAEVITGVSDGDSVVLPGEGIDLEDGMSVKVESASHDD